MRPLKLARPAALIGAASPGLLLYAMALELSRSRWRAAGSVPALVNGA